MLRTMKLLGVLLAAMIVSIATAAEASTDWNANVIQVKAVAPYPTMATNSAEAEYRARTAAMAIARRDLLAEVKGIQIDSTTTVENGMLTSDLIVQKVSGLLRGARVVSEGATAGGYEVVMELPLFGSQNSLASAVIERTPTQTVEPFPTPAPTYTPPVPTYTPPAPTYKPSTSGNYTGLVIDCRGFSLKPVMSPVIFDANYRTIYGHKYLDIDKVIRDGMASYARDLSEAYRAGSNPLVVRAIGIDDLNADPVISMEDTDRVLYENESSHFLEDTAVVFLY